VTCVGGRQRIQLDLYAFVSRWQNRAVLRQYGPPAIALDKECAENGIYMLLLIVVDEIIAVAHLPPIAAPEQAASSYLPRAPEGTVNI
jgi:hypothetical protein